MEFTDCLQSYFLFLIKNHYHEYKLTDMRQFLYALLGCLIFVPLNAQKNQATSKETPKGWMYLKSSQQISAEQLAQDKAVLQLSTNDDLKLLSTKNDDLGYRHYHYQQTYKNIPVEGAIYLMHEKANRTEKANGKLIHNISIHTVPHVSKTAALQSALQYVGADVYAWENATHQDLIRQIEQREDATFHPSGELVIFDPNFGQNPEEYRLAYKFDIYATAPLSRQFVYIDAQNGATLKSIERLHTCTDTPASGNSNYSDAVDFTACQENGTHNLKSHINGVVQQVFNAGNTLSEPQVSFSDSDGFFEADPTAVDVHFATQKTYEYFLDSHNRNSLDGNGAALYSWVHYGNGYNNAAWTGSWMVFGDGDDERYSTLTAPDVVAHEMMHGITQFANGLVYLQESGALNESFSDIFGEVVEAHIRGNNDWILGAEFTVEDGKNGIRNMSNPNDANMLTRQPDTYLGNFWYTGLGDNGGVHYNSGVQNYWFYLLSEGGNGTNDNGTHYDIAGIGMTKAAAITYRNLTTYLTAASQYADAREGAIQSAIDLYGVDSEEALQTAAAWAAVGLGELPPPPNCRYADSLALVALYNSTNGANWTNTWSLTQPMNTWYGVSVNAEGCVLRLILDENNLAGQLPSEIGDLSSMERLFLNNNPLSGSIPPEIGNAISLEWLWIYSTNLLSGPIPAEIGNLTNLTHLSLNDNQLSGNLPPEIGNLINLTSFRVSNDQISGQIPAEISNLSQLKHLNLALNDFSGAIPSTVGNLSQLENLTLSRNELSGSIPIEIGNLTQLLWLELSYNNLTGSIPPELTNLTDLWLLRLQENQLSGCYDTNLAVFCTQINSSINTWISNGNNFDATWEDFCATGAGSCTPTPEVPCRERDSLALVALYDATDGANWTNTWDLAQPIDTWSGVTLNGEGCVSSLNSYDNNLNGTIPPELGDLTSLTYLSLYGSQLLEGVIPPELGNLTNLGSLSISQTQLSGNIPPQLSNLSNLTYLSLTSNQLNGTIPPELGNLSNLTSLKLNYNQLSGNIPPELGNLFGLRYLYLHNNQLNGSIPPELGSLIDLIGLYLDVNQLSGNIPAELGNLNVLESLFLRNNQLSGSIPPELGNLSNLTDLLLYSNQLQGSIPPQLGNLNNIDALWLHDNQLSGNIPPELGDLSNLTILTLSNNQLSACYDSSLANLCNQLNPTYNVNFRISDGNNFDAPWEDFCATGAGTCDPVWPGDFNNDGIANNIDAVFWGLAAGSTGAIRPNATTNWTPQTAPEWSQSVIGVNSKHQDANGNGLVDTTDLGILLDNYGNTHDSPINAGANSPLQFEVRFLSNEVLPNGTVSQRFGVYLSSSLQVPISTHGLAFSLDLNDFLVMGKPSVDPNGSALAPSESIGFYESSPDSKRLDIALTRTDKQNQLIIDGDLINEFIIVVKDVQSGTPLAVHVGAGIIASANGTINAVDGTSLYNIFGESGADIPLSLAANVVHQQCNTLGNISLDVLEGTPPYVYSWSTGANTAEVTHLPEGTYTVDVHDANGQQQSLTIAVEYSPLYDEAGQEIICQNDSWLTPQLNVIFEGAYDTDTEMMTNELQQLNLLPDIQPYQATPWNYKGTEGQDWTAANYPDETVDWVLVSFRDAQYEERVYAKTAAILQQDGSLFFPNNRFLSAEIADSVHIVIQHRNHIAVMTPQPLSIDNNAVIHDFSLSDSYHPPSQYGQKQLPDGTWAMIAGDCEQSESGYDINGDDKGLWSNANGNFGNYFPSDLNLDGDVNGADKILWSDNNGINSVAPN